MYIGDWLGKRDILTPHRLALVDDATGCRYTYRDLNDRANRLAHALRFRLAIAKGDRVAILARNRIEHLDALFATGKLGAVLVPLNWRLTSDELAFMLEHCGARIILVADEFISRLPRGTIPQVRLEGSDADALNYADLLQDAPAEPIVEEVTPEDPHLILYTSGTTGRPKGAVLPHRVMVWNCINTNVGWDLRADDVAIIHTPFFHTGGINVLTLPIMHAGGTMVLMKDWEPGRCLELIEQEHVTVFFAVPTMFQGLRDHPRFVHTDWSSIRFCVSGGAPCPVPLIQDYQRRGVLFRQGYGLTEVSVNCFTLNPEDAIDRAGSVGRPNFHLDARVVDDGGRDVGVEEVGELWLRGPTVCLGYWNDPGATARVLTNGWFHTGDLVRVDADGYYYIVDRKTDMFISGGENVYPGEIERVLRMHPAVKECVVVAVADSHWGEVGWAAVVPRQHATVSPPELLTFCARYLAKYKLPRAIYLVDSLPLNASGKVVKRELRDLLMLRRPAS